MNHEFDFDCTDNIPIDADYLMIRKTMIKISERFSENGKSVETLIENVIQYSAGQLKK